MIDTLYGLGRWLLDQERPHDAVHVFRTMLFHVPDDERSWLGLGMTHERLGHDAAAAQLYELGEAKVPGSYRCPLARARVLCRAGSDDAADGAYDRAEERARAQDDDIADAIAFERRAR